MAVAHARDAAPRTGGRGGPPDGGPRFALRFEDGRGRLTLARPLRFALGVVERLELDLGPLRFPIDLSAGPGRFSTRRTRVRSARLRVDVAPLLAAVVEEPLELRALAPAPEGPSWALRDAFGTVAFETRLAGEGPDLRIALSNARAATEGPAPPLVRAHVAAGALGLAADEDRGARVVPRALSALLAEALVPHGWRVPDDRATRLAVEGAGPHRVVLRTLEAGEAEGGSADPAWEVARRLSPIVAALAVGQVEEARRRWRALEERAGDGRAALVQEAAALGLAPARRADRGPAGHALRLRAALRDGRADAAAEHARALADAEPCDAVAVEGLCAAADLAAASHPDLAAGLLDRAAARRPSDGRLALRLAEALARAGRLEELEAALESALSAREPGPERGAFAREAATVCELAGQAPLADRMWRAAAEDRPGDPRVLEGLAAAHERSGEHARALSLYDRAAAAHRRDADGEAEARACLAAARAAEAAGREDVAEDRLTRAAEGGGDAGAWAALARVRRRIGASRAARRAEDRLLAALERVPPGGAPDAVAEALAAAAAAALDDGRGERARSFLAALERVRPEAPELAGLRGRLDEAELRAQASAPARLWELPADRALRVLAAADDPGAVLEAARRDARDADRVARGVAEAARAASAHPALAALLAGAAAELVDRIDDPEALLALEPHAADPDARARLARAASVRFREAGRPGPAARALARAGAARRDTAMLRAALGAAERAGDHEAAREIVELALGVVGDGPARAVLEAVRRRYES
jgi:tetratricopeptide (TPR) repeat protein